MLFAGFATFSLLYATQPLLPLFAAEFGLSAEASSLAVSAATGPLAIGILIAGIVSDRLGRRPLLVVGMMAAAALTLLAAVVPGWWSLLALRVLTGLALAGVPAVAMAYVGEEVEGASVGAAMGLYIAGSALGGMGGRLIASVLADVGDWRWALAGVGAIGLAMAEAFRRLAPASRRFVASTSRASMTAPLRDPALLLLYGEAFVLMGAFVTLYNYAGFRLLAPPYSLGQAEVGSVFLLYLLGSASSAWFGAAAARAGLAWPIALLIGGIALTAAQPLPLVIVGVGVATIGFFGAHAIASARVGQRAAQARGQAAAWYLFFYYAGSSVLGSAGGVAWSWAGWPGVTGFCLVLGLLALLGAALLARVR
ncbi:MAG: transporter [Sphingomonas bacterium]|nr:transporter [Sphingomonas bacterium]